MSSLTTDHQSVKTSVDLPDEIPPDALQGLAGYAGLIRTHFPERVPAYCERVNAMLDELLRLGKAHEAPRFAAFLALLTVGESAR